MEENDDRRISNKRKLSDLENRDEQKNHNDDVEKNNDDSNNNKQQKTTIDESMENSVPIQEILFVNHKFSNAKMIRSIDVNDIEKVKLM